MSACTTCFVRSGPVPPVEHSLSTARSYSALNAASSTVHGRSRTRGVGFRELLEHELRVACDGDVRCDVALDLERVDVDLDHASQSSGR